MNFKSHSRHVADDDEYKIQDLNHQVRQRDEQIKTLQQELKHLRIDKVHQFLSSIMKSNSFIC